MAARINLRNYLVTHLKAGSNDKAEAIIDGGLDSYSTFTDFEEKDVNSFCSTLRRPGGTVQVQGAEVADRGVAITSICEMRLKIAVYAAKYYALVGRPINDQSMAWDRIKNFKTLQTIVKNHKDPSDVPEISKKINIMKAIELIEEYLRGVLGVHDVPLAYIIRPDDNTPAINVNPQRPGLPYGTQYSGYFDEMISCTEHTTAGFAEDSARVLNILVNVLKGTSFEVSIAPFKRNRDGRGAFASLTQHNLGTNRWEHFLEQADKVISTQVWNGRSHRYPLKLHVAKHREAHNNMIRASQFIPFDVPNETTRVRRFLASLQSSDPRVIAAKTTILADDAKKGDFEEMANFLLIAAPPLKPQNTGGEKHRISAVDSFNKTPHKGKTGVEFRFHSKDEYNKLSTEQKSELYEWRTENGNHKRKNKNGDRKLTRKARIAATMTRMEELEQTVAAMKQKAVKFQDEQDKENEAPETSKNGALRKPTATK